MAGNALIFLGGLAAAAGIGYYLYQAKYFDKILDAINDAVGSVGKGGGDSTPKPGGCEDGGLVKCKDGKCGKQSACDKQAKCKSGEHWNPSSKKCAKASNLAMAYTTPFIRNQSHRAYLVS